jgi:GNAT superfamily N-acetyltransferase
MWKGEKSMPRYVTSLEGIKPEDLEGFFVDWGRPPSCEEHYQLLKNSSYIVLALDKTGRVIGRINALSDGVCSAFIPLLEVLPQFQHAGIGSELLRRMLGMLDVPHVDLVCDPPLQGFYERFGMLRCTAMVLRKRLRSA